MVSVTFTDGERTCPHEQLAHSAMVAFLSFPLTRGTKQK